MIFIVRYFICFAFTVLPCDAHSAIIEEFLKHTIINTKKAIK